MTDVRGRTKREPEIYISRRKIDLTQPDVPGMLMRAGVLKITLTRLFVIFCLPINQLVEWQT